MPAVIKLKRSETALSIPQASDLEAGELALNIADGKFFTKTTGGTVKEVGGAGSVILNDVTSNGNITNQDIILNGSRLVFEGALENAYETFLTATEPTADRTLTLPNASGALATEGDALAFAIVFGS
jgi:hypothetical protein|tara:strand:- start:1337 stop:1717 length:381 start_codon:yes stop_codon:yes gene_type:complete